MPTFCCVICSIPRSLSQLLFHIAILFWFGCFHFLIFEAHQNFWTLHSSYFRLSKWVGLDDVSGARRIRIGAIVFSWAPPFWCVPMPRLVTHFRVHLFVHPVMPPWPDKDQNKEPSENLWPIRGSDTNRFCFGQTSLLAFGFNISVFVTNLLPVGPDSWMLLILANLPGSNFLNPTASRSSGCCSDAFPLPRPPVNTKMVGLQQPLPPPPPPRPITQKFVPSKCYSGKPQLNVPRHNSPFPPPRQNVHEKAKKVLRSRPPRGRTTAGGGMFVSDVVVVTSSVKHKCHSANFRIPNKLNNNILAN